MLCVTFRAWCAVPLRGTQHMHAESRSACRRYVLHTLKLPGSSLQFTVVPLMFACPVVLWFASMRSERSERSIDLDAKPRLP